MAEEKTIDMELEQNEATGEVTAKVKKTPGQKLDEFGAKVKEGIKKPFACIKRNAGKIVFGLAAAAGGAALTVVCGDKVRHVRDDSIEETTGVGFEATEAEEPAEEPILFSEGETEE